MAVKSKYELAVAAFVAAKARLYKPGHRGVSTLRGSLMQTRLGRR